MVHAVAAARVQLRDHPANSRPRRMVDSQIRARRFARGRGLHVGAIAVAAAERASVRRAHPHAGAFDLPAGAESRRWHDGPRAHHRLVSHRDHGRARRDPVDHRDGIRVPGLRPGVARSGARAVVGRNRRAQNRRVVVHRLGVRVLREPDLDLYRLQSAQRQRARAGDSQHPAHLGQHLHFTDEFFADGAGARGHAARRQAMGANLARRHGFVRADFSLRPGVRVHQLRARRHGAHDQPVLAVLLRAGGISRRARRDRGALAVGAAGRRDDRQSRQVARHLGRARGTLLAFRRRRVDHHLYSRLSDAGGARSMSDIADAHTGQVHHPGAATYLIIAAFLVVLTAMEITVFYVHALRPVLVPVLIVLAAAKFAMVAMFYMHLKYDGWLLTGVFVFPLMVATVLMVSLILLFTYLSHHMAPIG